MGWSEPVTWNPAARSFAKKEGVSSSSWLSWISILFLVGGLVVWEWSDADRLTRASIPELMGIIATLLIFFAGLGWAYVRLNRTNSTAIYERGMIHGSKMKKQWIPWDQIEYFYIDEDSIKSVTYRFLCWQEDGHIDESFSVVPDAVDLEVVIKHFIKHRVEQDVAPEQPLSAANLDDSP